MDKLVEQYTPQILANQKDVDAMRKAFKAELRNGPTQPVSFSNGFQTFTRQQAFGNFDLDLYHKAYDADLSAAGLIDQFDDHGLVKRNSYAKFKLAALNGAGECAKFAKELWVLQYGNSNYKLTNVPAEAKQLTVEEIYNKLQQDPMMLDLFKYSPNNLVVNQQKFDSYLQVFQYFFPNAEKLNDFLTATFLDKAGYETIKTNVCAMFTAMIAATMFSQKAIAQNRGFADSNGNFMKIERTFVDYNLQFKVPLRIHFGMAHGSITWPFVRISLRFKLAAGERLLDMPVYTSIGMRDVSIAYSQAPTCQTKEAPEISKMADLTFVHFEEVLQHF